MKGPCASHPNPFPAKGSARQIPEWMYLVQYNETLEKEALLSVLNEGLIERRVKELEKTSPECGLLFWLTWARLSELALYCAGNYADNVEFAAAGDLLLNPRLILVRSKKSRNVYLKRRHGRLTEQFRTAATDREGVIRWLKMNTILETKEEPLLPYLYRRMSESGCFSPGYLSSVDERMKKVAHTIGFLSSWKVVDSCDLHKRLQDVASSEKPFMESNLCRFGKETFLELGIHIRKAVANGDWRSGFFREGAGSLPYVASVGVCQGIRYTRELTFMPAPTEANTMICPD